MNALSKWCDLPWKIVVFTIGAACLVVLIANWGSFTDAERIAWILAAAVPAHIFEENICPGGFFYQNNLRFGSKEPMVYPQNRLTNMVTNLGAEIVIVVVAINANAWGATAVTLSIFFGVAELSVHTAEGALMFKRFKAKGKRNIYGPGEVTALFVLFPNAIWGIVWLCTNPFTWFQVLAGLGIGVGIAVCLILIPFAINLRVKSKRFAFKDAGYWDKYATQ